MRPHVLFLLLALSALPPFLIKHPQEIAQLHIQSHYCAPIPLLLSKILVIKNPTTATLIWKILTTITLFVNALLTNSLFIQLQWSSAFTFYSAYGFLLLQCFLIPSQALLCSFLIGWLLILIALHGIIYQRAKLTAIALATAPLWNFHLIPPTLLLTIIALSVLDRKRNFIYAITYILLAYFFILFAFHFEKTFWQQYLQFWWYNIQQNADYTGLLFSSLFLVAILLSYRNYFYWNFQQRRFYRIFVALTLIILLLYWLNFKGLPAILLLETTTLVILLMFLHLRHRWLRYGLILLFLATFTIQTKDVLLPLLKLKKEELTLPSLKGKTLYWGDELYFYLQDSVIVCNYGAEAPFVRFWYLASSKRLETWFIQWYKNPAQWIIDKEGLFEQLKNKLPLFAESYTLFQKRDELVIYQYKPFRCHDAGTSR